MPWGTLLLAGLAVLEQLWRTSGEWFIYERGLILQGEAWRLWTGHLAHFNFRHLAWNLAVFLPAGCWLERLNPVRARWFYLVGPLVISLGLLALDRTLARYAGLSALAAGTVVLLACRQLVVGSDEPEWVWLAVLGLVATKIILEACTGTPLLAGAGDFRPVPLAHLGGAGCGVFFAAGLRRKFQRS